MIPSHGAARGQPVRQGGDPPCARLPRRRRPRAARSPRLGGAVGRAGSGPPARRQRRRARDRHAEEHRLRLRQGVGVGDAGGVRAAARAPLPRRRDHAGAGGGHRGRVGADRRPRVHAVRARAADRDGVCRGRRGRGSCSGSSDLVVLKTTDSEFHGFPRDRYTTLAETTDRVLATAVSARWRHAGRRRRSRRAAALLATRSPRTTRCRCSRRCTRWARRCWRRARRSPRCACRCPTGTTSSSTSRRSG